MSLEYTLINEAAIEILEEELEIKDKLVSKLTNQLESADLEKRNINYKTRIVGLTKSIDSAKHTIKDQNIIIDNNALNKTVENPIYAFGSCNKMKSASI